MLRIHFRKNLLEIKENLRKSVQITKEKEKKELKILDWLHKEFMPFNVDKFHYLFRNESTLLLMFLYISAINP